MLITDSRTATDDLAELARDSFTSGVDVIQLRDPRAPMADRAAALRVLQGVAAGTDRLVSAYGAGERPAEVGVDLLQLSAMDGPVAPSRTGLSEWALVGRSCHSSAQVDAAVADPEVSFFTISPVFNPVGVGEAGLGLVSYAAAMAPPLSAASKPWFAVGGVTVENVDQVLAAGARRLGVTRAIVGAADRKGAAAVLKDRLIQAWNDDLGEEIEPTSFRS